MCQKIPGHGPARIACERVHRVTCGAARVRARQRRTGAFAIGAARQPVAIGFKKANANHVPNTNPEITS